MSKLDVLVAAIAHLPHEQESCLLTSGANTSSIV